MTTRYLKPSRMSVVSVCLHVCLYCNMCVIRKVLNVSRKALGVKRSVYVGVGKVRGRFWPIF